MLYIVLGGVYVRDDGSEREYVAYFYVWRGLCYVPNVIPPLGGDLPFLLQICELFGL